MISISWNQMPTEVHELQSQENSENGDYNVETGEEAIRVGLSVGAGERGNWDGENALCLSPRPDPREIWFVFTRKSVGKGAFCGNNL